MSIFCSVDLNLRANEDELTYVTCPLVHIG